MTTSQTTIPVPRIDAGKAPPIAGGLAQLALWSIGLVWVEGAAGKAFLSAWQMLIIFVAMVAGWAVATRAPKRDDAVTWFALAAAAVLLLARLAFSSALSSGFLDALWSSLQGGVFICAFGAPAVSAHAVARSRGALDRRALALCGTGLWLAMVAGGILARYLTPYGPATLPGPAWTDTTRLVTWLLVAAIAGGGALTVIGLRRHVRLLAWMEAVRAGGAAGYSIGDRDALGLADAPLPRLVQRDGDDGVLLRADRAGAGPFRQADVPVPVALIPLAWFTESLREARRARLLVVAGGLGLLALFWAWNAAIGYGALEPTRIGVMWLVPAAYSLAFRE